MTTDPDLKTWERAYADRLVRSVNALRERRGWTIPRLRTELALYGWSPSLETLNGILSARKRGAFSVGEVFAFARALDVSPLYLMAGLPSADPLPPGPMTPEPDTVSVYEWLTDSQLRILTGSAIAVLPKYAQALSMARWHNALWIVSDGRLGREYLSEDINEIVRRRDQWRRFSAPEWNAPDLPPLPDVLEGLDAGEISSLLRQAPWSEFSGDRWLEEAREYVKRLDERQAELDRLEEVGRGAASDTAE